MEEFVYTDLEALQTCIEFNLPGANERLQTYLKRNRFDNIRSIEATIKNLKMIYEYCNLKQDEEGKILKGKKRRFICSSKRPSIINKENNYKGTVIAPEQDKLLKEYVFNQLCTLIKTKQSKGYTDKVWSDMVNLFDTSTININQLIEMFYDYYSKNESKTVGYSLVNRLQEVNKLIIKKATNDLQKENRIKKTPVYFSFEEVGEDKRTRSHEISNKDHLYIKNRIKEICTAHSIDYKAYTVARINPKKTNQEVKKVVSRVTKQLYSELKIHGIFEGYRIGIINRKKHLTVSKEMMEQAYFEKLVALTERNYAMKVKAKDKLTGFVEKEYAAFNTLLLIHQHLGELELEERLMELLPSKDQIREVQDIYRQHGIDKARREAERRMNSETFVIEDDDSYMMY